MGHAANLILNDGCRSEIQSRPEMEQTLRVMRPLSRLAMRVLPTQRSLHGSKCQLIALRPCQPRLEIERVLKDVRAVNPGSLRLQTVKTSGQGLSMTPPVFRLSVSYSYLTIRINQRQDALQKAIEMRY